MGYFASNQKPEDIYECLRIAKANLNLVLEANPKFRYDYLIVMALTDIERVEKILYDGGVLDSTGVSSTAENRQERR